MKCAVFDWIQILVCFVIVWPLEIYTSRGEDWNIINRLKPATFVCLSQAKTNIFIYFCHFSGSEVLYLAEEWFRYVVVGLVILLTISFYFPMYKLTVYDRNFHDVGYIWRHIKKPRLDRRHEKSTTCYEIRSQEGARSYICVLRISILSFYHVLLDVGYVPTI